MLFPIVFVLLLQPSQVPASTPAKELKGVQGPIAPTYPDPAAGMGASRMQLQLRQSARRSSIPTVALPEGASVIEDEAQSVPGWKGYRAEVPAKSSLHARLKGTHEAWFLVKVVGRWGRIEEGGLHNRIPTGNPEASFRNFTDKPKVVYFIVDTTQTDMQGEAYFLHVTPGPLPEKKKK